MAGSRVGTWTGTSAGKCLVGAILSLFATEAAADSCYALAVAFDKEAHTPHRYDNVVMHDGKLEMEIIEIAVGGKTYIKMDGMFRSLSWGVSAWDPDKEAETYRRLTAKNEPTCHADGTDTIDGEQTDIIISVNTNGFTTRTWISRVTGLPVKEEGEPDGGRTSVSTYSYNNVTAPDTN
jgi:hypothetical protein